MYRKFGEIWMCGFEIYMQAERQTEQANEQANKQTNTETH